MKVEKIIRKMLKVNDKKCKIIIVIKRVAMVVFVEE